MSATTDFIFSAGTENYAYTHSVLIRSLLMIFELFPVSETVGRMSININVQGFMLI